MGSLRNGISGLLGGLEKRWECTLAQMRMRQMENKGPVIEREGGCSQSSHVVKGKPRTYHLYPARLSSEKDSHSNSKMNLVFKEEYDRA